MTSKFVSAKLFFAFAVLNFALGALAIARSGLAREMYLNPLAWVIVPGLLPLSEGLLSVVFGLLCLFTEWGLKRKLSVRLSLAQLFFMFVAFGGNLVIVRFWWRVLRVGQPELLPLPLWSTILSLTALSLSFFAFLLNLLAGDRISARLA